MAASYEEYEEINTPSPFSFPDKGGNRTKFGFSPSGFSRAGFITSPASAINNQLRTSKYLSGDVSQVIKSVEQTDEGHDEVDGHGPKTLTELKSCFSVTDSTTEDTIITVNNESNQIHLEYNQRENYAHNGGCESPASSQGSMNSGDYLLKTADAINRNTHHVHEMMKIAENVLPKEAYKLIQNYVEDDESLDRLRSFVTNDVMSTSFYTGACKPKCETAVFLRHQLDSLDRNAFLGVVGRVLLEKFGRQMEHTSSEKCNTTTANEVFEQMDTEEVEERITNNVPEPGRQLNKYLFENGQSDTTTTVNVEVFPGEAAATTSADGLKNTVSPPPTVPDYIPVANGTLPSTSQKKKKKKSKAGEKPLPAHPTINDIADRMTTNDKDTWEIARDEMVEHKSSHEKQVEKVGQVFFDAAFTLREKLRCTLSGNKKGSRGKKFKFEKNKVKFVQLAVAFILSEPTQRTTKSFKNDVSKPDFQNLDDPMRAVLMQKVFTEYAYRRRTYGRGKKEEKEGRKN